MEFKQSKPHKVGNGGGYMTFVSRDKKAEKAKSKALKKKIKENKDLEGKLIANEINNK